MRCWPRLAAWLLAGAAVAGVAAGQPLNEVALATRSGPRGPTMFKLLNSAQTGIVTENRYADPKMWGEHYQELAYGAMGTGVAIGDYDGDGRPDVFVVSKTETCRLFRNLGDWKFEDVTEKAGLNKAAGVLEQGLSWMKRTIGSVSADEPTEAWRQGATFVDVNNDGWLDLYICRFNAPNLLYINQHDGTFKEEAAVRGLAVNDASGMAAFCDYDRDGWLDVYIQTNMLDAAGHPNGQRDYLFHNNGDGTFTNVTDRAGITGEKSGHSATWWDYDGDGWPDIYVTADYGTPDRLYHNNRDGTFTNVINQAVPHMPYYAMGSDLGDVNNDGLIDLFVADMAATTHEKDQRGMAGSRARVLTGAGNPAEAPQYMRNALYLNTGTGRFLEAAGLAGLAATDWTWSVRLEDLDNDGRLDLHVTNGMIREYHNADLLDRIMGVENPLNARQVVRTSPKLAERHLAFRNLGDLQFEDVSTAWGLDQKAVSFGAAFGDLDGDGDLDLVYANYEGGVSVLRNDSDSGHRLVVALRGTQSNRFGVGATVRIETAAGVQVRQLVLARGYLSSSEPILHFGLGEDTRILRLTVSWPSGQEQSFTDLPADRRLTITEAPASPAKPATPAPLPPGQFVEVSLPPDREGKMSLPGQAGDIIAPADFDRDGHVDAFVASRVVTGKGPSTTRNTLWVWRGEKFDDVTDQLAPALRTIGAVTAALWSDVDGDGWPDLLVAVMWGPVKYFHNNVGRGLEDRTEAAGFAAAGTGWWNALASADFNGDGRPDFVAGNLGLNTQYHASAEHPALLFTGDFAGNGTTQSLEGYYEGDRLFPWLTRNQLGATIPAVLRRFPKNDQYARASLGEIVGEDRLAAAQRMAATEFRSGVFLSQPDGTYQFSPLPRLAQISPITGVVAGDFDGDGKTDLYAVQNSSSPNPAVGRFDGGLSQLFRGDGHGHFAPVPAAVSGLLIGDETKAVAMLDFDQDGWPDFLVTRKNGETMAYRNRGLSDRHALAVQLRGPAGNPSAIGARVDFSLADGTTQTAEIWTASGCFFGYTAAQSPRQLRVRWPDGRITETAVGPEPRSLTLSAPEGTTR